jgi:thiol-disulfide isomerase/thioredoxin
MYSKGEFESTVWLVIWALLAITRVGCQDEIFYTPEDHIKTVEGTDDFTSLVLNSDHISVVKFYANWCGYSKAFRPHYKQLAKDTLLWHKNVLQVVAYDCALEVNTEICMRKNMVYEFPTFKLYRALTSSKKGYKELTEDDRSEKFMRVVIRYIEEQTDKPSTWPTLTPYK